MSRMEDAEVVFGVERKEDLLISAMSYAGVVQGTLPQGDVAPLFNNNNNTVNFNNVVIGDYLPGSQYNALGGNDTVFLPSNLAEANQAGYDSTKEFNGGGGNDTIIGGTLDL